MPYDQFVPIVDLPHDSLTVQAASSRRQPQRPAHIIVGPYLGDLNACIGDGAALVMDLDSFAEMIGAGARYLDRAAARGDPLMRPALLSGFVAADAPIAVSASEDGRNVLLAIGEVGDRSFLWITPAQARSLSEQVARLLGPAGAVAACLIAPGAD